MADLLVYTRKEVQEASDSPYIYQDRAAKAYQEGNSTLMKRWVARAVYKRMITCSGLWHWLKWQVSGLPRHEYAVGRAYRWLKDNPVTLELN